MTSYRNPVPTVDVIIEVEGGIVLIERKNPPRGWALPGGFVDAGESVWEAAQREAREETGLDVVLTQQFFCYSDPSRDPRLHTISIVFIARADGPPRGGDDARQANVYPLDAMPSPLVFDHETILGDYQRYRQTGQRPPPTR